MKGKALGIIETLGLVPAIEAADIAVKSAEVNIQGFRFIGAGYVSVLMTGDVSSVNASIEACSAAAKRLGTVKSTTVIAKTAEGLENILTETKLSKSDPESIDHDRKDVEVEEKNSEQTETKIPQYGVSQLKKMSVSKLRTVARTFEGFSIPKKKINNTPKKELIEAIKNTYRNEEE